MWRRAGGGSRVRCTCTSAGERGQNWTLTARERITKRKPSCWMGPPFVQERPMIRRVRPQPHPGRGHRHLRSLSPPELDQQGRGSNRVIPRSSAGRSCSSSRWSRRLQAVCRGNGRGPRHHHRPQARLGEVQAHKDLFEFVGGLPSVWSVHALGGPGLLDHHLIGVGAPGVGVAVFDEHRIQLVAVGGGVVRLARARDPGKRDPTQAGSPAPFVVDATPGQVFGRDFLGPLDNPEKAFLERRLRKLYAEEALDR